MKLQSVKQPECAAREWSICKSGDLRIKTFLSQSVKPVHVDAMITSSSSYYDIHIIYNQIHGLTYYNDCERRHHHCRHYHHLCIISASSVHHQCIISASSAHHQRIISASSAHHQRIISASSVHHQCIISASVH